MPMYTPAPRSVRTTLACERCDKPLTAGRSCHEAYLYCEDCGARFPISRYAHKMDAALEAFLEALFCDRI